MEIGAQIKGLALELARIPSVVGTRGEVDIAEYIYKTFSQMDYFKDNPANLRLADLERDSIGRKYVMAFVEGKSFFPRTI